MAFDFNSLDLDASFEFVHPDPAKSRVVAERLQLDQEVPVRVSSGIDLSELAAFPVSGRLTVRIYVESIPKDAWLGRSWEWEIFDYPTTFGVRADDVREFPDFTLKTSTERARGARAEFAISNLRTSR